MSPVRPSILQRENDRLRVSAAAALERAQVGDADEAAAILEGVITLDGRYVEKPELESKCCCRSYHERTGVHAEACPLAPKTQDDPCPDPDGHLWVHGDEHCQVDGCTAIYRVPEPGGIAGGVLDGTYDPGGP